MTEARAMLDLAARLGMRAAGYVEPNPMVGAVIARDGVTLGMGHHREYGGPHAEREALADCRRRGHDPRGATVYVTLEPCRHTGKQPPCTEALIGARIARVVCARADPGRESGGGAAVLGAAGIPCEFTDASPLATRLSDPFVKRTTTGLPWVIAKWAQTIDGKIAPRSGQREWISSPLLRRRVHRMRARMDAILVGGGTYRTDNPMLTARDVAVRRTARRIVVTTDWRVPLDGALVGSAGAVPATFIGSRSTTHEFEWVRRALEAKGVEFLTSPSAEGLAGGLDLRSLLKTIADRYGLTNILVEGGTRLLGSLFDDDLVDEAIVHVAPAILADQAAKSAADGHPKAAIGNARRLSLWRVKRVADELELVYRRPQVAA